MAADLVIRFLGDTKEVRGKIKEVQNQFDQFGKKVESGNVFGKFAKAAALGLAGVATAAIGVGVASIHMADDWETSHARLQTAIKNTGAPIGAFDGAIGKLNDKFAQLGFKSSDVESAMAPLVNATHNTFTALSQMGLAADIARGRHIDLATAVGILTKVDTGHVALLGRIGINTKDATGKVISQTEAIKRLSEMYGGQAAAYTDTFKGKQDALKAQMANIQVEIGTKLIPILLKLADWITKTVIPAFQKAVIWVQQNWPKLITAIKPTLDKIIGYVTGFIGYVQGAWQTFGGNIRTFIKSQWIAIQNVFQGAFQTIQGLVDLFRDVFTGKWGKIWGAITNTVSGVWKLIKGAVQGGISEVALVFGGAVSAFGNIAINVANAILSPFRAVFNTIVDLWNATVGGLSFSIPSWVPGIGGKGFSVPKIGKIGAIPNIGPQPGLTGNTHTGGGQFGRRAAGGPVMAGQTYTVGERGPETLVMGRTSGTIIPNGGNVMLYATVYVGTHDDGDQIVNKIVRSLKKGTGVREIQRALAQ